MRKLPPPPSDVIPLEADGLVVTYFSDFYTVQKRDGRLLQCKRKALLKKQGLSVVVGDFVTIDESEASMGWITGILPPTTTLSKPKIHNISHVLIACPWQEPTLDLRQIDRLLTKVQLSGLSPLLVFTKADITPTEAQHGFTLAEWMHYYTHTVSVPTLATSIYDPSSIDALKQHLSQVGGRWVLAGVSGAGKSSLLNAIDPHLKLRVNEVSHKGGRGTHTTRHTELRETLKGLWIADAPGFSQLNFSLEEPTSIQTAFPECYNAEPSPSGRGQCEGLVNRLKCTYEDCLHLDEQDCVIKASVEAGRILKSRYDHYVDLVKEAQAGEQLRLAQSQKEVNVVKLNPEWRDANRKENRQVLKKLEQHIQYQQRFEEAIEDDEEAFNDEDF